MIAEVAHTRLKSDAASANVVIASGGRRSYLVEWFQEAMKQLRLDGKVIVTDADSFSAAYAAGDISIQMPTYQDIAYSDAMIKLVEEYRPALLISLNDYEIELLASGIGDRLRSAGTIVPALSNKLVPIVTDKLRMSQFLEAKGIRAPATVLGSDLLDGGSVPENGNGFVVKHRWGSGSSGLLMVQQGDLESAVLQSMADAPIRGGSTPEESVVVQEQVKGVEYGMDLIGPLGGVGSLLAVLARRKLRMRGGETAQAITVDTEPFLQLGERLYECLAPEGLIDIDLLIGEDMDTACVIDINPRFGGGYPFNHLAGANVPLYYLAAATRTQVPSGWLDYRAGVVSSKFEAIREVGAM